MFFARSMRAAMLTFTSFFTFLQILLIDISLAGDNAIAVGLAAAGLPHDKRRHAIVGGILAATLLRIAFAFFAVQLLHVTGLLLAGGLLLLWVAWKMYRDVGHRKRKAHKVAGQEEPPVKTRTAAILHIAIADVSMSLDNVLAVAGVARANMTVLIAGLLVSVVVMGGAAALVARLTARYPWIAYLGVAIVLSTALRMMWDGSSQLLRG